RARDDAGALPDPLVRGVDGADELVVRHQAVAAGCTHREDARPAAGGEAGDLAHAAAPLSSSATAASRSSGVVTPTEGTPRRPRFARPVSAPAGASSTMPVTPVSWNAAMQRSQRTGLDTWPTTRSRKADPDATTLPSRFVQS